MKEEPGDRIYSDFLDEQRVVAPGNLEKDILGAIRHKERSGRRIASFVSAAAIVVIVLGITLTKSWRSGEMDYIEKVALLLEAKSMYSGEYNSQDTDEEILYEDDDLLIYFK